MGNMSYCRHENTADDLDEVWEQWVDDPKELNEYEKQGRRRIIRLVREMNAQFEADGTYEEENVL